MNTVLPQDCPVDFGPQGGDPARMAGGLALDLSTCVNRYGPPPAVRTTLARMSLPDLQIHPYGAAEEVERCYGALLEVDPGELVAGRGTTEFIWALGREVAHAEVAVPLPAYTDYLRVFPGRGFSLPGHQIPSVELVDAAMRAAALVIVSNPHNPSGVCLDPEALDAVAARHPAAMLVVDESYADFTPDPGAATITDTDNANVVVLRSPSKFYGIAATRVGVAWCRDRDRLIRLLGRRETWPVSGLDAAVAIAAMSSTTWAQASRLQLIDDGRWLAAQLDRFGKGVVTDGVNVHYRCMYTDRADELAAEFADQGIGVRPLGAAHGVRPGAIRVLAPLRQERRLLAGAISAVRRGRASRALTG